MTKKEQIKLMDQIADLYRAWAAGQLIVSTDHGARLMSGLFGLAKKIDHDRMAKAFAEGAAAEFDHTTRAAQ